MSFQKKVENNSLRRFSQEKGRGRGDVAVVVDVVDVVAAASAGEAARTQGLAASIRAPPPRGAAD